MSCWKLSYDEQTYKQPAKFTTKKHNYTQLHLKIGVSSDCANICSRATFHARQNSPFTRPWSAQSCSTAVRRGYWPKGRRTNCSYLRKPPFSERYAPQKSEMVSQRSHWKKSAIYTRTIPQCAQVLIAFLIISTWIHKYVK
jgi:hypothetical protein